MNLILKRLTWCEPCIRVKALTESHLFTEALLLIVLQQLPREIAVLTRDLIEMKRYAADIHVEYHTAGGLVLIIYCIVDPLIRASINTYKLFRVRLTFLSSAGSKLSGLPEDRYSPYGCLLYLATQFVAIL